jgi:hypothetical protein
MSIETLKSIADVAESVVTTVGIIAAGLWTYVLFFKRRQRFPRATVSHQAHAFRLPDGGTLLRVAAKVANTGDVLVPLRSVTTRVQQLLPVPEHIASQWKTSPDPANGDAEFPWPVLGKREWRIDATMGEIEPGECEILHSDFVIPASVGHVLVYTHVPNQTKGDVAIGWSDTVVVPLTGESMSNENNPSRPGAPEWKQLPYRPDPSPPPVTPQLPYRPDPPPSPPPKKD